MPRNLAWLGLVGICACAASADPSLAFTVRFANPATAARAESVEVSILEGSCSSRNVIYSDSIRRDTQGAIPPALGAGSYAMLGRAASADCGLIAYGCVQITLPGQARSAVEIVLDDVPEQPTCMGECAERCGPEDAGSDAQVDLDASSRDAGTPPLDAGNERDASTPLPDASVDAGRICDGVVGPNKRCYRFEASTRNFAMAEAECVTWGGHLVALNDEAEELWVTQSAAALTSFGSPVRFWIGFSDGVAETVWSWLDQSAPASAILVNASDPAATRYKTASNNPYTHWGPNLQTVGNSEPNNGNGDPNANPGEDCAESRSDRMSAPGGSIMPRPEWDDSSCSSLKQFVCERP